MLPHWFTIKNIHSELSDVVTFDLFPNDDIPISGKPGQFNMLYVFGQGEIPISLSGNLTKHDSWRHTVKSVGAISQALCGLKEGDQVGVRGPFGTSWPLEKAKGKDLLIIAGGLGLAPLRPVIYHCLNHLVDFKNISLLYGARDATSILFKNELETWGNSNLNVLTSVDRATKGCQWGGHVGVVTNLISLANFEPSNTTAMICGPEIMMRFVSQELVSKGLSEEEIYISMERNMKCAIGHCGHCQLGGEFICKDGPVFTYSKMKKYLKVGEL